MGLCNNYGEYNAEEEKARMRALVAELEDEENEDEEEN